ncbi:MAG: methylglyoxal synthase [Rhodospirillales bacterium]
MFAEERLAHLVTHQEVMTMDSIEFEDRPLWALYDGVYEALAPLTDAAPPPDVAPEPAPGVQKVAMTGRKKIGLIAHDNRKADLLEWARYNRDLLARHAIYATGTTGKVLAQELGIEITNLQSGPLGGDQQIGGKIAEGEIDFLIFFWDPLQPMPHDPDVKALLRLAVVWNIPIACNRASADFIISSPLMGGDYDRLVPDFEVYRSRPLAVNT